MSARNVLPASLSLAPRRLVSPAMMRRLWAMLLVAAAAIGCSNYDKQFEHMCQSAKEVRADSALQPSQRMRIWADKVDAKVSGKAKKTFDALGGMSVEPKQRYETLKTGAAECGVEGWQCDEILKLFEESAAAEKSTE